jgi:hypothetical protein
MLSITFVSGVRPSCYVEQPRLACSVAGVTSLTDSPDHVANFWSLPEPGNHSRTDVSSPLGMLHGDSYTYHEAAKDPICPLIKILLLRSRPTDSTVTNSQPTFSGAWILTPILLRHQGHGCGI